MATPNSEADADLLYGVAAIAVVLGLSQRQAKHRIAKGQVPAFRIGRVVCASRSGLRTWLAEKEAAARQSKAPELSR